MRERVVVVDDHDLFRGGLVGLLAERCVEVIGEAALGAEGIRLASELRPDVVLMDLIMPGMSGLEATRRLAVAAPATRVLVLTVVEDEHEVIDALLAGACGYVLKDAPIEQVVDGIAAAARGESLISPRIARQLVRRLGQPAATPDAKGIDLSPREHEVLELLVRGLDNGEIAQALHLSQHTIKNHVSSLLVKFQAQNRMQVAVHAIRTHVV